MKIKNIGGMVVPEHVWGVCLWEMPSGGYISDGDGYLSCEGYINDKRVEQKMREAAKYWTGNAFGQPVWFAGYRKITDSEYEDQVERMEAGKIPDPVDELRQKDEKS